MSSHPKLFNILLDLIISTSMEDNEMKTGGVLINNLQFANNIALFAESPNELQAMVNRVVDVSENHGMKVNIKKTEV